MRTLVALLVALALAAPASAAKFTPAKIVGTWSGTWTNTTFGSQGTIMVTITSPDALTIQLSHDVSGNVFGCADPDPAVLTLVSPTDWGPRGLRFARTAQVYGAMTAKLTKALVLKASSPASCGGSGPKWALKGKIKKNVLKATINITFADGQVSKAKAVLNVPRTQ